jgi:HD-like signal output (HDOD) protein
MNLKRCFEIFKIGPEATEEELNRAYRDLVNVWHPDRFEHNPRLKQKVETQLKEINHAREKLLAFFDLRAQAPKTKAAARRWAEARARAQAEAKARKTSRNRTRKTSGSGAERGSWSETEQETEAKAHNKPETLKKTPQEIRKEINRLPLIDVTIWKVISLLDDPNSNFEKIAEQVSPDIATRFLSMASSAFYGRKVDSISYAVRVLGYGQMKKLLITSMLFEHFTRHLKDFSFVKFQAQAHFCAATSKALGQMLDYPKQEDLFTVAMLHNIGKLVLAVYFRDHHRAIITLKKTERMATSKAEMQVLGMTHAEIGALLLERFNIPKRICDAVKFHDIQDRIVLGQDDYRLILISKQAADIVRQYVLPEMEAPLSLLDALDQTINTGRRATGRAMENEFHDQAYQDIFPQLLEKASSRLEEALGRILERRDNQSDSR